MLKNERKTTCRNCGHIFSVADNRAYKIRRKYAPFWFFDALRQFENFSSVECPSCGHKYRAEEARLFFFFKSPYTIVFLSLAFLILAILISVMLK